MASVFLWEGHPRFGVSVVESWMFNFFRVVFGGNSFAVEICKAGCLNWGISAVSLAPDTKMRHANPGMKRHQFFEFFALEVQVANLSIPVCPSLAKESFKAQYLHFMHHAPFWVVAEG